MPMKAKLPTRGMNRTESEYALQLKVLLQAGEIQWFDFEPIKIRLADATFYTPDFGVVTRDGNLELHEVKGFWREDARVKIKVAAERFPARFIAVTKRPARMGGGWEKEYFGV